MLEGGGYRRGACGGRKVNECRLSKLVEKKRQFKSASAFVSSFACCLIILRVVCVINHEKSLVWIPEGEFVDDLLFED